MIHLNKHINAIPCTPIPPSTTCSGYDIHPAPAGVKDNSLATPTGLEVVARLLGGIESGAYQ